MNQSDLFASEEQGIHGIDMDTNERLGQDGLPLEADRRRQSALPLAPRCIDRASKSTRGTLQYTKNGAEDSSLREPYGL